MGVPVVQGCEDHGAKIGGDRVSGDASEGFRLMALIERITDDIGRSKNLY